ncbi:MAG: nucleotidyl transferase AbiEii/AbiGii toxin family protein [Thermoanaerobaculia bacterium]
MDRDEILQVLRAFEEQGLEYVLIGAAAMGFHGIVRATEDLDFFIGATAENVERLKRAFRQVYSDDPNIDEISADDLLGDFPAVRYYPPSGDLYFDVMTRLGDVAAFDTIESVVMEVEGIRVWVATPHALYRLKKDTVRPLDRQDAEARGSNLNWRRSSLAVEKYRSGEEMNAAQVTASRGNGFDRFLRQCARYWTLAPRVYPRGVVKFRSVDEAQKARAEIVRENVLRLRARGLPPS